MVANSNDPIDGDGWSGSNRNDLYLIINAVKTGAISLQEPVNDWVYYADNSNLNYKIKYVEPADKMYGHIVINTTDFLTGAPVESSRVIDLSDDEQTVGWHEINRISNINRVGYFKTTVNLTDSIKSENNFSIFGAEPDAGTLLSQKKFDIEAVRSDWFSGQVFRPAASGNIDSLTLRVSSTDPNIVQGHSYWSIYEWNGNGNDSNGSAGALLATTTSKFLVATTYPSPVEETWNLPADNKIFLDSNKYYYLTLSIASDSPDCTFDCRPAMLFLSKSNNGSLIDGRLISQYRNQGDLYLILNKKN
jgi:hypothetical protein